MDVQIIVFCIVGVLSKTLEEIPCMFCKSVKNNAGYCSDDNQDPTDANKRNVAKNSVASIETDDTTLGISEKQSRIPTIVTWYLLVFDRLRHFFLNSKDVELMRW